MLTVISKDGTKIAYDKMGQGFPVILIDGALAIRSSALPLAELLAPHFTVYCYDRRGRGDSTDTKPYSPEKEVEDIEALMDAAGGSVHLCGTSSGGALALEAAIRLGDKVGKMAMYEVPYDSSEAGVKAWREYSAELADLLAADRRGDAVALFMKLVGVPKDRIEGMRQAPMWQSLEALAPTLAYDGAVLGEDRKVPVERAASVNVRTLVMDGAASHEFMPFMRTTAESLAKAIPNARHQVLEGQGHDVDPNALAPVLTGFFGTSHARK
jgi:pimeloyl-ACP methyl ester carboxylesterase